MTFWVFLQQQRILSVFPVMVCSRHFFCWFSYRNFQSNKLVWSLLWFELIQLHLVLWINFCGPMADFLGHFSILILFQNMFHLPHNSDMRWWDAFSFPVMMEDTIKTHRKKTAFFLPAPSAFSFTYLQPVGFCTSGQLKNIKCAICFQSDSMFIFCSRAVPWPCVFVSGILRNSISVWPWPWPGLCSCLPLQSECLPGELSSLPSVLCIPQGLLSHPWWHPSWLSLRLQDKCLSNWNST